MKEALSILTIVTVLLYAVLSMAHDKVVVIPLNSCSDTTKISTVTSLTGRVWMDRNLGASRVATSSTDSVAYGDLYQWGRLADGHERRVSATTSTKSDRDVPLWSDFTLPTVNPTDWRGPQNDKLWQGVSGTNNPCPSGFRLPSDLEWETERASWSSNNAAGAFASPLKLVAAGRRTYTGTILGLGSTGNYWSNTVYFTDSRSMYFYNLGGYSSANARAFGYTVRCLKD